MIFLPRPYPMTALLTIVALLLLSTIFVPRVSAQQTLENPQPDSFQSGVGVISGWACEAQTIEISFNGGPRWTAGTGTLRTDTAGVCGDTDNGYGLLYNWNLLGEGAHTVTAYADGAEFASVQVIVTTLGTEFLRGVSGTFPVADFPTPGASRTLRWQEAQQNFVISAGSPQGGGTSGAAPHVLENPQPGSFQSGVGVISGWACEAQTIEISFNGGPRWTAGVGTLRTDTAGVCGDTDNGFGLLYNWNILGNSPHTVTAYADGVEFAEVTVTVTTLGEEFRRGLSREVTIPDFPDVGTDTVLQWQEAQQNFVITQADPTQRLVAVAPVLTLPAGVSMPNVAVTSLYSDTTSTVRASPEPTLLLAEDAGGTVLLALANREGGLLGEGPGEVGVSISSTAAVLVALAGGYRLPEVDRALVDQMLTHPQWPALTAALSGLLRADPHVLDRIFEHPEVVALIREVGTSLRSTPQAVGVRQGITWRTFAAQSDNILPDGITKDDFGVLSPWAADAPWQWFGEATRFFLPVRPPFLAQSWPADIQATANPNFVDYVLKAYQGGQYHDWYHTPRNATQVDKLLNSGAAMRELNLPPGIDQVRFERYRWTANDGPLGLGYSVLNTYKMLASVLGLVTNIKAVQRTLDRVRPKEDLPDIVLCAEPIVTGFRIPDPTGDGGLAYGLRLVGTVGDHLVTSLAACTASRVMSALLEELTKAAVHKLIPTLAKKFLAGPASWVLFLAEATNSTAPVVTSYFAPSAEGKEYYVAWTEAEDGPQSICAASPDRLPEAPTNLELEEWGPGVRLSWDGPTKHPQRARYRIAHEVEGEEAIREYVVEGTEYLLDSLQAGRSCFTVAPLYCAGAAGPRVGPKCFTTPRNIYVTALLPGWNGNSEWDYLDFDTVPGGIPRWYQPGDPPDVWVEVWSTSVRPSGDLFRWYVDGGPRRIKMRTYREGDTWENNHLHEEGAQRGWLEVGEWGNADLIKVEFEAYRAGEEPHYRGGAVIRGPADNQYTRGGPVNFPRCETPREEEARIGKAPTPPTPASQSSEEWECGRSPRAVESQNTCARACGRYGPPVIECWFPERLDERSLGPRLCIQGELMETFKVYRTQAEAFYSGQVICWMVEELTGVYEESAWHFPTAEDCHGAIMGPE